MKNESESPRALNLKSSRRKYLKGAVGGGLATFSVSGLAVAQSDDTVTRPVTVNKDGPVRTKTVPREWDEHRIRAETLVDTLQESHMDRRGVKVIGLTSSESKVGGLNGFAVEVEVDPDTYQGGIPESQDGIPVNEVEAEPVEFGSCGVSYTSNNIPGGVTVEESDDAFCPVPYGTLTARFYDGSEYGMLTCCHVVGGEPPCPPSVSQGDYAYHNGSYFGQVKSWDQNEDWAFIDLTTSKSLDDTIWDEYESSRVVVSSWYTDFGITTLMQDDVTVRQEGVTTGVTFGQITGKSQSSGWGGCVDWDSEGVEASTNFGDGDSGGPVYTLTDSGVAELVTFGSQKVGSDLYSVQCHPVCSPGSRNVEASTRGTAIWHINNQHGIYPD